MMAAHYTIYGDSRVRETVALSAVLVAKGIPFDLVPQTASLSLVLATRAGSETGPFLRTPEGFLLADLRAILEWIESCHPEPPLMPTTPVRRVCARILEDWIECWLPLWPRRSWSALAGLETHLGAARFLLGDWPCRPDYLLAAWLETEVFVADDARRFLAEETPGLVALADGLLEWVKADGVGSSRDASGRVAGPTSGLPADRPADDAIPISLLPVLEEIATDYHAYLVANQQAWKDRSDRVCIDLGFGKRTFPSSRRREERRATIGRELAALDPALRLDVRRVLEPVGAWHALTLPAVVGEPDPTDPRSL